MFILPGSGKITYPMITNKINWKVDFLEKKVLLKKERESLLQLWNSEYPIGLNYSYFSEFENYLEGLEDQFHLLVILNGEIKGWYFDFLREDERSFGLILHSDLQGKGIGTYILSRAKTQRSELHGWIIPHESYLKADGKPYKSPQEFYSKNGFDVLHSLKLQSEKISAIKIMWKL